MTERIVRFPLRGRARAAIAASHHEQLRLQDTANLLQALTLVTETRDAFLKFADGTQRPDASAMFIRLARVLDHAGAEISQTIHHAGDNAPT
jgi:hypothetical protein